MFSQEYAQRASQRLDLINRLRDAGAQIELDLPTLVVCGNQSAGKSSLLQSLAGISLPRSAGTCTRTVTEVRLRTGDAWAVSLKLRLDYDASNKPAKESKEFLFAKDITNPLDVEVWVARAQKALLNPSKSPDHYYNYSYNQKDDRQKDQLKFTRNTVCIHVAGAQVNLTLIDLPGIIRNVENPQDAAYIDLIQELVSFYISKPKTIIVATISCKDEIENQAIVQMAKHVDPQGLRTLGVLTKPDTIEKGTHDKWMSVLQGAHYQLKMGYYMIQCPSKDELDRGITSQEAKEKEMRFFSTEKPWADLSYMNRFGMDALRNELGQQLSLLSDAAIPELKVKAEAALTKNAKELSRLAPALSDNPRIELLSLVRQFSTLIHQHITASHEYRIFYQKVRQHFEDFKVALGDTKPIFSMADIEKSPRSSLLASTLSSVMPAGWVSNDDSARKPSPPTPTRIQGSPVTIETLSLDPHKPMTCTDLRRIIDSQKGRELHGYSPYTAFSYLVSGYQEDWEKLSNKLMAAVSMELLNLMDQLNSEVFGRFFHLSSQVK